MFSISHRIHRVSGGGADCMWTDKLDSSWFNVTELNLLTYLIHPVKGFVPFFFHGSSWLIKVNDLFTLSYPHLFQIWYCKRFPHTFITLNNSLSNLIIPSQRLVTMSASLCTQTVLSCLIIQVLNIKSLLPKCLIQSLSLLCTVI